MEILNTITVHTNNLLDGVTFLLVLSTVVLFCVSIAFLSIGERAKAALFLVLSGAAFALAYVAADQWSKATETHYEVVVTDQTKFDPYKWQVLETHGKILVVKEVQ